MGSNSAWVYAAVLATALGLESDTGTLADLPGTAIPDADNEGIPAATWWRFQALLLAASHVTLFAVANWFFAKLLYRDYEAGFD